MQISADFLQALAASPPERADDQMQPAVRRTDGGLPSPDGLLMPAVDVRRASSSPAAHGDIRRLSAGAHAIDSPVQAPKAAGGTAAALTVRQRAPSFTVTVAPPEKADQDRGRRLGRAATVPVSSPTSSRSPSPWPGYHMGKAIQQAIGIEMAKRTPLPAQERCLVDKGYFLEDYLIALKEVARVSRSRGALRFAGPHACLCHQLGSPVKAHDVEEKSIKESTLQDYPGGKGPALLAQMADIFRETGVPVLGRVGRWTRPVGGELLGFYVCPEVQGWEHAAEPWKKAMYQATEWVDPRAADPCARDDEEVPKHRYYVIRNVDRLRECLRVWLSTPDPHAVALAPDLDFMDLRYPQDKALSQGGPDEERLLKLYNMGIAAVDPRRAVDAGDPANERRMLLFAHGAQRNFVAFAKNVEPGRAAPLVLTKVDLPVAAIVSYPVEGQAKWAVSVFEITDMDTYRQYFPIPNSEWVADETRKAGLSLVRTPSPSFLSAVPAGERSPSPTPARRRSVSRDGRMEAPRSPSVVRWKSANRIS